MGERVCTGKLVALLIGVVACGGRAFAADMDAWAGAKSSWHGGFERYDFLMDEGTLAITPFVAPEGEKFGVKAPPVGKRRCIVVAPKVAAAGRPWSWQGCYWDHEPQTEVELLRRGFHIAFVTPDPGRQWDAWYAFLTEKHGLSKKPAFVGMSKGGVNEFDWATVNPDKVSCIYADNPAIRPEAFARLGELARNDVPLLHVCGSLDFLLQRHTLPVEERYRALGGRIGVMIKEGAAHHPHSLRDPKPIADFIEAEVRRMARADESEFAKAGMVRSTYYVPGETVRMLKEERTLVTCRGFGFTPCYDRYDAKAKSQWGLSSLTVIVPATAAGGRPWVMRADAIDAESAVDQALLAKGWTIVVAPLTEQSGPVKEQWDATYAKLTGMGYAKKVVLEGPGAAAGEAYAWAGTNPQNVACIVAENPAMRSLMSKTPPTEGLAALAKAGVRLVHECGAKDPWLEDQTRVVEKRYKELGGEIAVIVREGMGHRLRGDREVGDVVGFVVGRGE